MTRANDLRRDFRTLGRRLRDAEPSEAATVARERRIMAALVTKIDRGAELRADYDVLARMLRKAEGAGAAAIVRERRLIAAELDQFEAPPEVPFVDELAARRANTRTRRPPSRRRKSG